MRQITDAFCWPLMGWEFGSFGPLWVREEHYAFNLKKPIRLLYASDLHLGHWWTKPVIRQLIEAVRRIKPDLVVLGGDLVDNASALPDLRDLLANLIPLASLCALPGNHDACVGESCLKRIILECGGHWLPDAPWPGPFLLDGSICQDSSNMPRVLCAHYPSIFPQAVAAGYRLVLAGHLHGGQCVWVTRNECLYPAAWINRWHVLKVIENNSTLLVSRGLGDTFPFRFRCPREILLCCFS